MPRPPLLEGLIDASLGYQVNTSTISLRFQNRSPKYLLEVPKKGLWHSGVGKKIN